MQARKSPKIVDRLSSSNRIKRFISFQRRSSSALGQFWTEIDSCDDVSSLRLRTLWWRTPLAVSLTLLLLFVWGRARLRTDVIFWWSRFRCMFAPLTQSKDFAEFEVLTYVYSFLSSRTHLNIIRVISTKLTEYLNSWNYTRIQNTVLPVRWQLNIILVFRVDTCLCFLCFVVSHRIAVLWEQSAQWCTRFRTFAHWGTYTAASSQACSSGPEKRESSGLLQ